MHEDHQAGLEDAVKGLSANAKTALMSLREQRLEFVPWGKMEGLTVQQARTAVDELKAAGFLIDTKRGPKGGQCLVGFRAPVVTLEAANCQVSEAAEEPEPEVEGLRLAIASLFTGDREMVALKSCTDLLEPLDTAARERCIYFLISRLLPC